MFVEIRETQQKTRASELKICKTRTMTKIKQSSDFWSGDYSLQKLLVEIALNLDGINHPKSKITSK